jgi:hypothetical protein
MTASYRVDRDTTRRASRMKSPVVVVVEAGHDRVADVSRPVNVLQMRFLEKGGNSYALRDVDLTDALLAGAWMVPLVVERKRRHRALAHLACGDDNGEVRVSVRVKSSSGLSADAQ